VFEDVAETELDMERALDEGLLDSTLVKLSVLSVGVSLLLFTSSCSNVTQLGGDSATKKEIKKGVS
jgi:hypothetical protein